MARKIEIEVVGDTKGFTNALGKASGSADGFGKSLVRMGGFAAVAIGAAGIGGLAAVLKVGSAEFAESSKVAAQTGAVLKSTGEAANVTAQQVSGLAEALMKKSGVDDEAIASGENMLLTFTKIRNEAGRGNDIFNQATKATLDLSVAMGKDMSSSAILVGKALNDPLKGMTALSRAGIQFTADQKTAITAMVESGNVMGAQKAILKELETQFGGSAEAAGKTLPGQLNILKESLSNTAGEVVASLVPALESILPAATKALTGAISAVGQFLAKFSQARGLEAKVKVVIEAGEDLVRKAIKIGQDVGGQIADALGKVNWGPVGAKVANAVGAALKVALPAALDLAGVIAAGFLRAMKEIDWVVVGGAIGAGMKDGMKKGATDFIKRGGQELLMAAANPMEAVAKQVGDDVAKHLTDAYGKTGKKGIIKESAIAGMAIEQGWDPAIATAVLSGNRIGAGLATGMAAGIAANAAVAAQAAALMVNHAYSAASSAAQMHSPSKLFEKIGRGIVEGTGVGLDGGLARLTPQAQARFTKFMDDLKAVIDARKTALSNSLSTLGDSLNTLFAANTQKFVDALSAGWDKQINKVRQWQQELTGAEQALRGLTASEAALAALDKTESERGRAMAVTAAQEALAKAQSVEDSEERARAIIAAEEQLRSAQLAITRAKLQEQATAERDALVALATQERTARDAAAAEQITYLEAEKAREVKNLEDLRAVQQIQMNARLAELVANLQKHPKEWGKTQAAIIKLLGGYGVDYRAAGKALGSAFAYGLTQAETAVEKAAKALAKIPQDYLKLHSPAKKGPLSTINKNGGWLKPLGPMLAKQMAAGVAMPRAAAAMAGAGAAPRMGARASGGWPERIVLQVDGRTLTEVVRKELQRINARN